MDGVPTLINNRETATVFWLSIFAVWLLSKREIRSAAAEAFWAFLQWPIIACKLAMLLYASVVVACFWEVGLWNPMMVKDTLLWLFFSGFFMVINYASNPSQENFGQALIRDSIKLTVLIEFLINSYVFPLYIEMVLVPFVTVVQLVDTYARTREEYAEAAKFTRMASAFVGFIILAFAFVRAFNDWSNLGSLDTLRSIAFPPLMTVAFIPFVYVLMLIITYKKLFNRLEIGHEKAGELKRYAKYKLVMQCGFSLKRIRRLFEQPFGLHLVQSKQEVDRLFE